MGGRPAGRVPHSPPLVRQIKRCGGTGKQSLIFLSHCVGSHQYDPSEWCASLSEACPLRLGAGRTVAVRRSSLGHFPRPPLPPAPLRRDCSAPLPTGTPPTLFVFCLAWFLAWILIGLAATSPTPPFGVASAPTTGCPRGKAPFAPRPTRRDPTPPLRSAFLRIAPRPCASVPIEPAARSSATRRSARAGS